MMRGEVKASFWGSLENILAGPVCTLAIQWLTLGTFTTGPGVNPWSGN